MAVQRTGAAGSQPIPALAVPSLTGVVAVSFDVDGTLADNETRTRRSLREVVRLLRGRHPDIAAQLGVEELRSVRESLVGTMRARDVPWEEVRRESFRVALASAGLVDESLVDEMFATYFESIYSRAEVYDDVLPTLDALRGRFVIGALSNGNTRPSIMGLQDHLTFGVYAEDHGVGKPDARIFHIAAEAAGCRPEQMLHVGDSLEDDVHGAQCVGAPHVWLNRHGVPNQTGILVHREIASLRALLDLLAGPWSAPPGSRL